MPKGCVNRSTLLNGSNAKMTRYQVPVTFNGKTLMTTVNASNHDVNGGETVWMGYPQLRRFGITTVRIDRAVGGYRLCTEVEERVRGSLEPVKLVVDVMYKTQQSRKDQRCQFKRKICGKESCHSRFQWRS